MFQSYNMLFHTYSHNYFLVFQLYFKGCNFGQLENHCGHLKSCLDVAKSFLKVLQGWKCHPLPLCDHGPANWTDQRLIWLLHSSSDASWDFENPTIVCLGKSAVMNVTEAGGRLWCACGNTIYIMDINTLGIEVSAFFSSRAVYMD